MKDRIKHYIEHKGISAGELAILLDVQRSNISHILNGRNKPGAVFIEKFLIAFPDLNARWLLTGEGKMNEDAISEIRIQNNTLPFSPENAVVEEVHPKIDTEPKALIKEKKLDAEVEVPLIIGTNDDVEKMILLFKDGTFATYKNRGNSK